MPESPAAALFRRPPESYDITAQAVDAVLADPANPLLQTARNIPSGAVVLDIGAGNGLLGRIVRALDPSITIDGVEPSEAGASQAAEQYRTFHNGYAEDFLREHPDLRYDVVVLNDVIEHLADPVAFLRGLREAVGPTASFLLSTPNVAYLGMRLHLLSGRFDYVDSGILERTHLRFFSRRTLLEVFRQSGLHARRAVYLQRRVRETEFAGGASRVSAFLLPWVGRDPMAFTYQFLFLLEQRPVRTEEAFTGRRDRFLRMVLKP